MKSNFLHNRPCGSTALLPVLPVVAVDVDVVAVAAAAPRDHALGRADAAPARDAPPVAVAAAVAAPPDPSQDGDQ